jgi:hypothetical protein
MHNPAGPTADDVCAKVRSLFAPEQVAPVIRQLSECVQNAPEGEKLRVQLAVLKLYDEDPARDLEKWLAATRGDYRDALFWAEYPRQARYRRRPATPLPPAPAPSKETGERFNERLHRQFVETGVVDAARFLQFAEVESDPNASSVGWLEAHLRSLAARLREGASLSLHEPSSGRQVSVSTLDEFADWAERHFPVARLER